jgi:hypothetical protein
MTRTTLGILGGAALLIGLNGPVARAQNPIKPIANKMTNVVIDLGEDQTGPPVQAKQTEIVQDLDALIAELEKQCAACRNGIKKNNPTRGMADSMISGGTGGIGNLADPGDSQKDWAKLSDRERDRILQSMSEGFPPEYRTVLERYYRRLAEEKTVKPGADPDAPAAPDADADPISEVEQP